MAPETDPDCPFCLIVAGRIPSTIVAEDERTVAFMDINPASYGHLIIVPKAHTKDVTTIPAEDLTAVLAQGQALARRALDKLGADGVNVLANTGAAAWQTVFHFHLHVIPRYADDPERDRLSLPWIPTPGDPEAIAAAAAGLRA